MASCPIKILDEQVHQLSSFVELCKKKPEILHSPQLKFFKDFLESLHAKIPEMSSDASGSEEKEHDSFSPEDSSKCSEGEDIGAEEATIEEEVSSSEESDLELDCTGVLPEPDEFDATTVVTDESIEVTEEMIEESNNLRMEGSQALSDGDFDKAVTLFTDAIKNNPQCAALYAKRAWAYLKQNKPNAAIYDSKKALELNPDQALAFKCRGYAHKLLGNWNEAARDLSEALRLDYDESAYEWMKQVSSNVNKIESHNRKLEAKRMSKQFKKKCSFKPEQNATKQEEEKESAGTFPFTDKTESFAAPNLDSEKLFSDPDILKAFSDPEMLSAFKDISQNPANIIKYQDNPKIAEFIKKVQEKMTTGKGD